MCNFARDLRRPSSTVLFDAFPNVTAGCIKKPQGLDADAFRLLGKGQFIKRFRVPLVTFVFVHAAPPLLTGKSAYCWRGGVDVIRFTRLWSGGSPTHDSTRLLGNEPGRAFWRDSFYDFNVWLAQLRGEVALHASGSGGSWAGGIAGAMAME